MAHQFISSDEIIASVWGTFKINYSDWQGLARQWVADSLSLMGIFNSLEDVSTDIHFTDGIAHVPVKFQVLRAVEYNGVRIGKSMSMNHYNRDKTKADESVIEYSFDKSKSNVIINADEGCLTFHYKSIPVDCNGFPMVLDDANLKEAIKWYVLYQIILNGYKHPAGIDWREAYQMFQQYHGWAKTSANRLTSDDRRNHMNMWTTLLSDPSAWGNTYFSPTTSCRAKASTDRTNSYKLTFNLNVAGAVVALEPTVAIVSNTNIISFYRTNGTYKYQISADGFKTAIGSIGINNGNMIKNIELIRE